jgi:Secretion system C-terminal sorting domain
MKRLRIRLFSALFVFYLFLTGILTSAEAQPFTVSPTSLNVTYADGGTHFTVTNTGSISLYITFNPGGGSWWGINPQFRTINPGGHFSFQIVYQTNSGAQRSATFYVKDGNGDQTAVTLTQAYAPIYLSFNFANRDSAAPGSDLWPITWADDNNLYTAWGDGGGFGGTNEDGRVECGIARISGSPGNDTAVNVWGGVDSLNPTQFGGKISALLCVNDTLWGAWNNVFNGGDSLRLIYSANHGASWNKSISQPGWQPGSGEKHQGIAAFIQMGKNYTGNTDGYVYALIDFPDSAVNVGLARCPKHSLGNSSSWQFLSGLDGTEPVWSSNFNNPYAMITDTSPDYGSGSCIWIGGQINSFVYIRPTGGNDTLYDAKMNSFNLYRAPNPWGPWNLNYSTDTFGNYPSDQPGESLTLVPKTPDWLNTDSLTFYLVYSGGNGPMGNLDQWNLVKGIFSFTDGPQLFKSNSQSAYHNERMESEIPSRFSLKQNQPNPFNPSTNINFSLPSSGTVSLQVYNIMGQLVMTVINNAYMSSGKYQYSLNLSNMASGVYFYRLQMGDNVMTKKMVLLK